MRKILPILFFLIPFGPAIAQKIHVNGLIKEDYKRTPLPGATIQVKHSQTTSVSDPDGRFRMYANVGDTLEVKFLGFTSQSFLAPADESDVLILLKEDFTHLEEVEVTGALGILRSAKEMGSSATLISTDKLNEGKAINPIFGLSSKVAGLRVNMYDSKVDPATQIVLRGNRSLQRTTGIDGRNPNEPIYVVDGNPMPNINRLNPNDIESITVLKGANAAALYGSEGVNGAIMITTKAGKAGK